MIKIADFGIARVLSNEQSLARSIIGTPLSLSPEVVEGRPYSFKSDVWSLGCVLCESLWRTRALWLRDGGSTVPSTTA